MPGRAVGKGQDEKGSSPQGKHFSGFLSSFFASAHLSAGFAFFIMLKEGVSLGKLEVPENYLEARIGASPPLHSLLHSRRQQKSVELNTPQSDLRPTEDH